MAAFPGKALAETIESHPVETHTHLQENVQHIYEWNTHAWMVDGFGYVTTGSAALVASALTLGVLWKISEYLAESQTLQTAPVIGPPPRNETNAPVIEPVKEPPTEPITEPITALNRKPLTEAPDFTPNLGVLTDKENFEVLQTHIKKILTGKQRSSSNTMIFALKEFAETLTRYEPTDSMYEKYTNAVKSATRFFSIGRITGSYWRFGGNAMLPAMIGNNHTWLIRKDKDSEPIIFPLGHIGRFYMAIRGTYREEFFAALGEIQEELNAYDIPMRFKVPANPNDFARADAGVVYFEAANQQIMYEKIVALVQENPDWFRDKTPLFTTRILGPDGNIVKGLGFAMDPKTGSSFGGSVSTAIKRACKIIEDQSITDIDDICFAIIDELIKLHHDPLEPAFFTGKHSRYDGHVIFAFIKSRSRFLPAT